MPLSRLPRRGVLRVSGEDRATLLQGLVSNDVTRAVEGVAIYAALLTAQGKYLHDFFIVGHGEALLIEGERERLGDLLRRLKIYRLRAKVAFEPPEDWSVAAAWGHVPDAPAGGVAYRDPRLDGLGWRVAGPGVEVPDDAGEAAYDDHRLALGVPDGSRDLVVEKSILLENGFDELGGVDWKKGCYVGQELTARTKYRGLVKKRLMPVRVAGALPEPGTPVMAGEREAGEVRSGRADRALALLRLDVLDDPARPPLTAGEAILTPEPPDWFVRAEGSALRP